MIYEVWTVTTELNDRIKTNFVGTGIEEEHIAMKLAKRLASTFVSRNSPSACKDNVNFSDRAGQLTAGQTPIG